MATLEEIDRMIAVGRHRDAIVAARVELVREPANLALHARLADAYLGLETVAATRELEFEADADPTNVAMVGALVAVQLANRQSVDAASRARRLVRAAPSDAGAHLVLARALHRRGALKADKELVGHALGSARAAMELAPDDHHVRSVHDAVDADLRVLRQGRHAGFGFGFLASGLAKLVERRADKLKQRASEEQA